MDRRVLYINQPYGLGDILFLQGLVDKIWKDSITPPLYDRFDCIMWGIGEQYWDIAKFWNQSSHRIPVNFFLVPDNFIPVWRDISKKPMEEVSTPNAIPGVAINFISADRFFPAENAMRSKVHLVESLGLDIPDDWDWRDGWFLKVTPFDSPRVESLLKIISEDQDVSIQDIKFGNFVLTNRYFGTPPDQKRAERLPSQFEDTPTVDMKFYPGTNLWDWIPLIQVASEIHTVETSVCYLVDKFATSRQLFQYEKRRDEEPRNYFRYAKGVYKNPNWRYEGEHF